jgi:3-oxoacyl-[acyl-carrier-protein] synthase-3
VSRFFFCQFFDLALATQHMVHNAYIVGTGAYAPPRVVTNQEMSQFVDTSDEWIRTRTGIKTRHLIDKEGETTTVDMAEQAAKHALEMSNTSPDELEMIIVATVTPDYRLPSASCLLQLRLGAKNACAFDVVAACAGSLYGLTVANQFIGTKKHKKILLIGAETMSIITNWTDRNTCVLFGDAASAVIIEPSPTPDKGLIDSKVYSDATHWQTIWIPQGGSKTPLTPQGIADHADRVAMNGRETFKFAVRALPEAAIQILEKNGLKISDVNHVVAHQANLRIIEGVAERLDVPMDKFVINIDRYANTSSASLFTTYDEANRQGRFAPGDLVLMLAIGSGFVWGAGLYRA